MMKKTIATVALATLVSIGTPMTAGANPVRNDTWPVQPPAEWSVPYHSKYLKYKGMDCWKYWRVIKCIKP